MMTTEETDALYDSAEKFSADIKQLILLRAFLEFALKDR